MPFLTIEDLKCCFSLFCCVCGVGSLGLAGNYASAGYAWATVAFFFMAGANTYATWCLTKVLLVAPKTIFTLGDVGDWCMGKVGRYVATIAQCLLCTLMPIVFLVLGSSLLVVLFPDSFGQITWIVLMAITLLPVCLIPTMKEGSGMAAAGCLGTIVADAIALALLISNMKDQNPTGITPPSPDLTFKGVTTVFGNLALAYGACIIVPSLHHEHSEPERMPRMILFALTVISVFFFLVSILGVFSTGCQTPGNLLFAVSSTTLGFTASRGWVILAFLFMQLHVTIAFSVIFFPVFQILERLLLGLHKIQEPQIDIETPALDSVGNLSKEKHPEPLDDYAAPGAYTKVSILRIAMIAVCVVVAVIWKDHLSALMDFVGASTSSICNMILPILFYLKTFWPTVGLPEKIMGIVFVAVSCFLAVYVSIQTGKALFTPSSVESNAVFPYCAEKFQMVVFTNTSHYKY
ncbi:Amino Acid/Auxin Permease (AAAP) Family [Thraustotheca clavata]|uniref:Amino Acid/Auxin Permease (AAAP) Family n=1 Tax=Thraustotheca clavata TaxID=74557 RepID=A0A1V9ZVG7_9STRA|nr:Amino Acid/Auxin Permease (AAAP) Family [Thraustotheca clavata]